MKVYKIGILGTENSHAAAFAKLINLPDENGNMRYPDFKVTTVFGDYPEENERIAKDCNVPKIAGSIEEMLPEVDAVMVCARDGKHHYRFAKPFIDANIPLFLDKPATVDAAEVVELFRVAKASGTPICGGSSLKHSDDVITLGNIARASRAELCGGYIAAPIFMDSPYSGFYFYAAHLVEICLTVFGRPKAVRASVNNGNTSVVFEFDTYNVCGMYSGTCYEYACGVIEPKQIHHRPLSLIDLNEKECDDFVDMVRSGTSKQSYDDQAASVFVMNAIERAYSTGNSEEVQYICI